MLAGTMWLCSTKWRSQPQSRWVMHWHMRACLLIIVRATQLNRMCTFASHSAVPYTAKHIPSYAFQASKVLFTMTYGGGCTSYMLSVLRHCTIEPAPAYYSGILSAGTRCAQEINAWCWLLDMSDQCASQFMTQTAQHVRGRFTGGM